MENYWSDLEYNKLKLLLHNKKVESVFGVLNGMSVFDALPPISVELHLTNKCNLKCNWCTDRELKRSASYFKNDRLKTFLEYCSKNNVGVTIEGGGEPTIYEDFEEVVKQAADLGLKMGLISNGVKDISHLASSFKWIRISVDASTQDEYIVEKGVNKYNSVIKNLELISKNRDPKNTHVGVGYVLTNRNTSCLLEAISTYNKLGIDYMYLRPVEECEELSLGLSQLIDIKTRILEISSDLRIKIFLHTDERIVIDNDYLPCVAHSLTCIIRANGDVVLCEKRRHDPIILGNINDNDFIDIWNSEHRKAVSAKLLNAANQKGCAVCRITAFNRVFSNMNNLNTPNFI